MKAIVLTGLRRMEMQERPAPRIAGDQDVLLRVGVVGVCGSDVHYYTHGKIGSQVVKYPYAVGHEFSATVQEVGKSVRRVRPGDRVAVEPAMSCGACDQCKAGRRHTCRKLRFLGCPGQAEGCLCEYIVMPEDCCFPVRKGTTLEQAAIAEPLSIGVYAVKLAGGLCGKSVVILGAGPIGLSVLLAARVSGAKRVAMTDKIPTRLAAARKAGADWTGLPKDLSAGGPDLFSDVVFECCGQQEALDQGIEMLHPGGRLMVVGIPAENRVSFAMDTLRRREIGIQNVRRQNECMQPALDLIENGSAQVDFMATHRFPLQRTPEAFAMVADYRDGVIKALIHVDQLSG